MTIEALVDSVLCGSPMPCCSSAPDVQEDGVPGVIGSCPCRCGLDKRYEAEAQHDDTSRGSPYKTNLDDLDDGDDEETGSF